MKRTAAMGAVMVLTGLFYVIYQAFLAPAPGLHLPIGAYRSDAGRLLVLSHTGDDCLRYVYQDGEAGRVCDDGIGLFTGASHLDGTGPDRVQMSVTGSALTLQWNSGRVFHAQAVETARSEITFYSDDTRLYGRLLTPPGADPKPVVVLVQGSSRRSAVLRGREQHFLSANGIATFVYDKRGTGRSGRRYTQDFEILAADAAAALVAARSFLGPGAGKVGIIGLSQGGWVAPLAARVAGADFVVVGYGLAVSPAEEERAQIVQQVARAGFGAAETGIAAALAEETVRLAAGDFRTDTGQLKSLRTKAQPFLHALSDDNITGRVAAYPPAAVRLFWPFFDVDTTWFHDAEAVLKELPIPQLWLLGLRDEEAPPQDTIAVLEHLKIANPEIDIRLFDDAGHVIIERPAGPGHPRERYVAGYIPALIEFILAK